MNQQYVITKKKSIRGTETILVVEDEPRIRKIVSRDLEGMGYKTLEAENGDIAKEIIESGEPINLLFSDIMMPVKMDGHKLAVWTEENYPEIKIVLTSGYSRDETDANSGEVYPFYVIRKPYSVDNLATKIKTRLAG